MKVLLETDGRLQLFSLQGRLKMGNMFALMRGGSGNVDLRALISALNSNGSVQHTDLINILNAMVPPSVPIVVFQWANGFDPTVSPGVAVPAGKIGFGIAASSPEEIWINVDGTATGWADVNAIKNFNNIYSTLQEIIAAYNGNQPIPPANYFNPLGANGAVITIPISSPETLSFRIHLSAVLMGTETGVNNVQVLINLNTPSGGQTESSEGITGQAGGGTTCTNQATLSSIHTLTSKAVIAGDSLDVDIECFMPQGVARFVKYRSAFYGTGPGSVGSGIVCNSGALKVNTTTTINSVLISLYSQGSLALINFDHANTLACKLENCY